jgi:RimJ/RimL family protein N-acetyltransferase
VNSQPVLRGARVTLRRAVEQDVDRWLALGRDPEIFRLFGISRDAIRPMTRDAAAATVQALIAHPHSWMIEHDRVIGSIRLDNVQAHDRRASMAIGILDPAQLGHGLGTEATRLVLGYAFGPLALHRISVRVLAFNARAIRSYEKCGFTVEGREREAACVDGTWHDDLIMGILAREYVPDA